MNFELAEKINTLLQSDKLDEAIVIAERELKTLSNTPFHAILDRHLLHNKESLISNLNDFYEEATNFYSSISGSVTEQVMRINPTTLEEEQVNVTTNWDERRLKAIYGEMNGFTINYDRWFVDLFAYSFCNDLEDPEWLADFEFSSESSLTITGFEDLQNVYRDYIENEKWQDAELEKASDICELLILLRLQQLFQQAHIEGKNKFEWAELPFFVTAHEYDLIYRID